MTDDGLAEDVDRFIVDAMNRGIIPMHVAADLSQYLVVEWLERQLADAPPMTEEQRRRLVRLLTVEVD